VRFARFGPVLQLGESPDPKDKEAPKPKFAPLPNDAIMDDVTLEQALPMFNLPRVVGATTDGKEITADVGRFGPYIKVDKTYVSIKGQDPLTITEAEARTALVDKQKKEKERNIADFGKVKILNGPYGPYVTDGKKNARIPKDQDPKKLTQVEAETLLKNAAASPKRRRFTKRAKK
jgi:DNA topoisomerase-1